jgi:hypothetical protein
MDDYMHYAALRRDDMAGLWGAACVTWVDGLQSQEVARRFGGDLRRTKRQTVAAATREHYRSASDDPLGVLVVGEHGDWVVVVEPNGFQGSRREVLRELTRDGGRAASVYWNENADNALVYSVGGRVVTALDMVMFPGEGAEGDDPHALDAHLSGLPFGPGRAGGGDCFAAGLTVGERISGARLDDDWLAARHLRVLIKRLVPEDISLPGRYEGHHVLAEPEIAAVLAEPTRDKLREIAVQAALIAARRSGIHTDPSVATVLAALRTDISPQQAARLRAELLAMAERRRAEFEDALEQARQGAQLEPRHHGLRDEAWAITAVAGAFHPDPAEAAHLALFNAPSPNFDEDDHVRLYVLRRCERRAIAY